LTVIQPIENKKQENAMSRFPKTATPRPLAAFITTGAIAAVLVLSTINSAWAADTPSAATPAPQQTATPASSDRDAPTGTHIRSNLANLPRIVVYPGAVHGAGDAQWTDDDTSAPELPMARE
jgi:hypothetical protein